MQCSGINIDGRPCEHTARAGAFCIYHDQIARAMRKGVFALSIAEVCERVEVLTIRQQEALYFLCNGRTYESAARELGITKGSLTQRVTAAKIRAGVKSRSQLVCLYSIWRARKVGLLMP